MTTENFWRRTLAIATVAAAAVALSGCSIISEVTNGISDAVDDSPGTTQDIFSLEVGDCEAAAPEEGEVEDTKTIDCAEPHQGEIYAASMVPDGDFPGDAAIGEQAEADCYTAFESFVGISWDDSIYNFSWYFPTESSWADGDREILCIVYHDGGESITGSLAGAAL
ncbi:septum formation family protein [Salinibacterium sp. PAMC 21357]|uniref:septum formation family protein n=1 Tax=Salinibacterium sp. PAMC 21357 TaxID=1112215 RepID=UPI00028A1D74|nr:septum formation family protein [Salinibacterium sp. PAMC 21357]